MNKLLRRRRSDRGTRRPRRALQRCTGATLFTSTVRLGPLSCASIAFAIALPLWAQQPQPADRSLEERQATENWLQLESDRRAYRNSRPEGTAQESRILDLQLQQQGLADRQQLLQDQQARDQNRRRQALAATQVTPAPGVERLRIERRQDQMRLRDRIQRQGWP